MVMENKDYILTQVDFQLMEKFKEYLLFTYKIDNKLLFIKKLLHDTNLPISISDIEIIDILKSGVTLTVKNIDLICTLFDKPDESIMIPADTVFFVQKLIKYIIQVFDKTDIIDLAENTIKTDTDYCLLFPFPMAKSEFQELMFDLAMQTRELHAFFTPEIEIKI